MSTVAQLHLRLVDALSALAAHAASAGEGWQSVAEHLSHELQQLQFRDGCVAAAGPSSATHAALHGLAVRLTQLARTLDGQPVARVQAEALAGFAAGQRAVVLGAWQLAQALEKETPASGLPPAGRL